VRYALAFRIRYVCLQNGICMCVCVCVCVCVWACAHTYLRAYGWVWVYMSAYMYGRWCVRVFARLRNCLFFGQPQKKQQRLLSAAKDAEVCQSRQKTPIQPKETNHVKRELCVPKETYVKQDWYKSDLSRGSAQEWTNRTLSSHERTSVHFLVLPGSLLSITEITEYTYISLI